MTQVPIARRRVRLRLRGIVQGVGFRPFIYNLATELGLAGNVLNSSAGLVTEVEGSPASVERFVATVLASPPPLAWIQESQITDAPPRGDAGFSILASVSQTGEFALVSPDVATCPECLEDITDPKGRRFGYAFTNCTNCGPRYTIIRDVPYDRSKTTMAVFPMCPECRKEYEDPRNRRFHAQPNACPVCGPSLSAELEEARRRLADGGVVAVKGLGGFHLACDARNAGAVAQLRNRKRRSDKPFALMARDLETVRRVCEVSELEAGMLAGARRPIVILGRRDETLPDAIAPGNRTLGVMLPYTPLHHLMFAGAPYDLLVMTSGNLSEEPIVVSNSEAADKLASVADWTLTHNRDIHMRADDSVVRAFEGRERLLRRSRGYVPETLPLGHAVPEILACGGELKNAFCLTKGSHAIFSQHIGDLENYETLVFFEETLANLKRLFRVEPCAVAYDLHPRYLGTSYALGLAGLRKIGVQHHHAHIASCMAENGLQGQVIGVAFDGAGYAPGGSIWGGEFLVAGYAGYERRAHLREIPLAGGDAAVREPWRAALAYLTDALGPGGGRLASVPEERQKVVRTMIEKRINTVRTSSCGRLFDAVSALAGVRQKVTFEGQAAIELEAVAEDGISERYPFEINSGPAWEVDFRPAIERIAHDAAAGVSAGAISAKFHNALGAAVVETCTRLRAESGLNRVCLSGGSFQNVRLAGLVCAGLRACGFEAYLHSRIPPNDGGIALGQAVIAAEALK